VNRGWMLPESPRRRIVPDFDWRNPPRLALPVSPGPVRLWPHITLSDNPRTMIAPASTDERLSRSTRIWLAAFALALATVLVVARGLEPDPRGFGTHTQLGLWPCSFKAMTGRPCPTCGMTTSFAWFARGELARSWGANPVGILLATITLAMIPWLLLASARARPWPFRDLERPLVGLSVAVVALTLISWTVRMTLVGGR
jgi:hypothetical protein